VEILDLRHFSSVDLRSLLDDEIQVWSRMLSWDYSGSSDMILRYVDAKILPQSIAGGFLVTHFLCTRAARE